MAQVTEKLLVEIGADIKDLKDGLKKSSQGISKFSSGVTKLGGVLAGVFAVSKIKDFAVEMSTLAGEAEGVEAAFTRMGGGAVLDDLRKATAGTVSNLELMKAAVQAKNFDIPLKTLSSLFQFATKRAQDTGESVDFLTQSIVTGIGRKSPLILDNLGISAVALKDALGGATAAASSVGEVAEAVGKIAQTEMAKAGKVIETTAIKTARWGATVDNLKVTIGKELNKALNALAPLLEKAGRALIDGFGRGKVVIRDIANFFIDLYNRATVFRAVVQSIKFVFQTLWETVKLGFNQLINSFKTVGALIKAVFTGEFKAIPGIIKDAFTTSTENFKEFGGNVAQDFQAGFKEVISPETQIQLLSVGDEQKAAVVKSYQDTAKAAADAVQQVVIKAKEDELTFQDILNIEGDIARQVNEDLNKTFGTIKKGTAVMEVLKNNAESFGFALGEMAVSGERSIKRLIQQFINMAQAIFLAKSASLGIVGLIGGLAGFGIIKGLASQIGGNQTYVEGDKLRVVQENSVNNDRRRF